MTVLSILMIGNETKLGQMSRLDRAGMRCGYSGGGKKIMIG